MSFWRLRPSALASAGYATMSVGSLHKHYEGDNRQVKPQRLNLPTPPPKTAVSGHHQRLLRTCQWNINHLRYGVGRYFNTKIEAAEAMAKEVIATDADVLILSEYGVDGFVADRDSNCYPILVLTEKLQAAGYQIHVAASDFPTAIATRLSVTADEEEPIVSRCFLDPLGSRSAVGVRVQTAAGCFVRIYGTHLEASDYHKGKTRLEQIQSLLQHIHEEENHEETIHKGEPVLIIGDFNQQRQRDYTPEEWEAICANKKRRDAPTDDGVAAVLENAGFVCNFDCAPWQNKQNPPARTNWKPDDPPPATHWSGTIIDYAYGKGENLRVGGIYVSPNSMSDHRMVATDWEIMSETDTEEDGGDNCCCAE